MDEVAAVGITRSRRVLCLVTGALCLLGIVCATTVLGTTGGPHHHPHNIAAAAVLTDGHGTNARTIDAAVVPTTTLALDTTRPTTTAATVERADDVASVTTVRTRGPPAGL